MSKEDRSDYKNKNGIASWWKKDGCWHIALPCPDPENGYTTGGSRWTGNHYHSKDEAIAAIHIEG